MPETSPGTVAILPYHDERVRSAIHEAKYHGSEHAFDILALALVEYLRDADDAQDMVTLEQLNLVLVPIPLGKKRKKERGYNQAEEIAKRAAKQFDCMVDANLLMRTRETTSQVSLQRHDSRKKYERSIRLHSKLGERSGITYIILDDVLTTGAHFNLPSTH